jgi:hypothetical protein
VSEEIHTIKEWGEITGIVVLDPDGFDRGDPKLHERMFTRAGFMRGTELSTCKYPAAAMTPHTPETPMGSGMVTDAEAAEIVEEHEAVKRQAWLEVGRVEYEVCIRDNEDWPCSTSRLLADRERMLAALEAWEVWEQTLEGVTYHCAPPEGFTHRDVKRGGHKALKEAGRGD